jgi:RNA polymerase sigma factor (sigma-70 family)
LNLKKLITKSARGNSKAQKILYEKYIGFLYSVVFRYIKNEADAEDVLMEIFMKIFLKLKDFKYMNEQAFVGWIKTIAINDALMFIRQDFSVIHKVGELEDYENIYSVSTELLHENELIELVEQLPDGYKTIFLLYAVDGYSHKEIGEKLKIAESTSRSQFFKARNLLQKKLGNYYGSAIRAKN